MKHFIAFAIFTFGLFIADYAHAKNYTWKIRVMCGREAPYDVYINAQVGGQATKIAERQNPGCRVMNLGPAK